MTFNSNDINEFLVAAGYPEWNGEVCDKETGEKRLATKQDFNYSGKNSSTTLAFNFHGNTEVKDMKITDFQFITYSYDSNIMESGETQRVDKDFSTQWIQFLLKNHGKVYAKQLFDWSISNMSKIEKTKKDAISQFIKQENEKYSHQLDYFNTLAEQSMKYLPAETIDSLNL